MHEENNVTSKPYEVWAKNKTRRTLGSRFIESLLKIGAYFQIGFLFACSILSVHEQYTFSAVALLILICLSIDAVRKYGVSGLKFDAPLGSRFYVYWAVLLFVSLVINVVVYIRFVFL